MSSQPTQTPPLKLYIPLFIALVPALATGFIRSSISDCVLFSSGPCETYASEFKIFCIVLILVMLVSLFALRRTIVMVVSALTIAWHLYILAPVLIVSRGANDSFGFLMLLVFLPAIIVAGIAMKRCVTPTTKSIWQD